MTTGPMRVPTTDPPECGCSYRDFGHVPGPDCVRDGGGGHPEYFNLIDELLQLHRLKSGGYGTVRDPFENFTRVADLSGQPRYIYPIHRSLEKHVRILSLLEQGRIDELDEEFKDAASLLLCAAAMLREDTEKT